MASKKSQILIACLPQAYTRIFAILPGHELSFASTLSDAKEAIGTQHFNMIMIGVHFDESNMFDLLHHVRADDKHGQVPVVCFRGIEREDAKSKNLEANCETACTAMGASYFDLTAFADDERGNAAVRQIICDLLPTGR
jgi:DNA-binding NtrC family response regulator